ncbi:MAG: hypothetical protein AAF721_17135 [Myxococcota bacterium]
MLVSTPLTKIRSLAIASTVALSLVAAPRASAATRAPMPSRAYAAATMAGAPDADAPAARITVDATALGDAADAVAAQVDEGARNILDTNGMRAVDETSAPEVVLTITPLGGDKPGYRCDYEVKQGGATVEGSASFSDCRLCTESELVETAQAVLEQQLPALRELSAPKEAPAKIEPKEEDPDVTDPVQPQPGGSDPVDQGGKGLGTLGKAGIAVGVVGVAALVPGIVLAVLPPKPLPNAEQRETTVPGIVLAAAGGAALVTGVALLVVDVTRAKKDRNARLLPSIGPRSAGLSLTGRF